MSLPKSLRLYITHLRPYACAAFFACALCLAAPDAAAQAQALSRAGANPADDALEPTYRDYKGVSIGMAAEEVRRKLGAPQDKSDAQDFFVFSEKETAQVVYDSAKKVSAVAVIYMNAGDSAPTCKAVLGTDLEAKADGSMYKLVRYPKAGYWVSYSRTAGDTPLVTVTMQKN